MGRFVWFATIGEGSLVDATESLKRKIAAAVQRELQQSAPLGSRRPFAPPVPTVGTGIGKKRMYLQDDGGWHRFRSHAQAFDTKEEAEAAAFSLTTQQTHLLGKIAVEKLWYEPQEIDFRHQAEGRAYISTGPTGMGNYLSSQDLITEGGDVLGQVNEKIRDHTRKGVSDALGKRFGQSPGVDLGETDADLPL